jgi:hypothetical protein
MRIAWFALAVGVSAPIAAGQSAVRDLPPSYGGGVWSFTVTITISPPPVVEAAGLEDLPPTGWPVSNISDKGGVDPRNGKVKWGPYFGTVPGAVSYDITVPTSASGPACFAGNVSFDGLAPVIGGDRCVYGPVPAISEWGALVLGISLLIGGTLVLHRRASNSAIL